MKAVLIYLCLSLCLGIISVKADNPVDKSINRARAEGVVLKAVLKDYKNYEFEVIVLDLSSSEVKEIAKHTDLRHQRLMSEEDWKTDERSLKKAPSSLHLSFQVVELHDNTAVILAGTPLKGASGSRDRFALKQANGKWVLVKREPYEIS